MANLITKQLSLGNGKRFDPNKITCTENEAERVTNYMYIQSVYDCTHEGFDFKIRAIRAYMGIDEVTMTIDLDLFKSKAAMIRFYRSVKELVIVEY